MGEALALDAAWLFAAFLILLVLAASGIAARRFLLERRGATVECGLRQGGRPWRLGLASYQLDEFRWYRIFGFSMRPERTFPRRDLVVVARRPPTGEEVTILGPGRIVAECQAGPGATPARPRRPGPGRVGASPACSSGSNPRRPAPTWTWSGLSGRRPASTARRRARRWPPGTG